MLSRSSSVMASLFLVSALLTGCTGGAPVPAEGQVLQDSAHFVWGFIDEAKKARKADVIEEKLSILMESLDAQADAFGGKLIVLRDAGKTLQASLQAGAPPAESVQKFADAVSAVIPEPQNLGE
ncbi:hypothetical protein Poly24_42440 [Rosistilla carotiformis]|uniref:Uncharacterized protein n=1 Tax=Rosistilla carotiformis TaxID=2528017 RepID=A0A518JYA3_9BACT|nr:hypothetical protein [Rosistilla carotiformis]QDV70520.1 hypothetical protein Poly24_42440 [Rosistilla carotiformis]